jgi:hypothetical protein
MPLALPMQVQKKGRYWRRHWHSAAVPFHFGSPFPLDTYADKTFRFA